MTDDKFTVNRAAIDAVESSDEFQRGLAKADSTAPLIPKIGAIAVTEQDRAELALEQQRRVEARVRDEAQRLGQTIQCERHGPWRPYVRLADGRMAALPSCAACAAETRLKRALGRSGIPPRFQFLTLDAFDPKLVREMVAHGEALQYAKDFATRGATGHCMILFGNFGTGKTHLACGIGLELIRHGYSVAHFTVMEIVRRWRESWAADARVSERDVLRGFVDVDFLILEEIGRQKNSEAERSHLFEILDGRYGNNKPTLITSNYPLTGGVKSIEGFLGQAAYDRLYRNGCTVVEFDWESYTRRGRA